MSRTTSDLEAWLEPEDTSSLTNCDREPIHSLSAIQPHGVLVVLSRTGEVVQQSTNAETLLESRGGVAALLARVEQVPDAAEIEERRVLDWVVAGEPWLVVLHRVDTDLVIEAEPACPPDGLMLTALVSGVTRELERAPVEQAFRRVLEAVRRITGFDRVLAYRFGPEGHGTVVEEACNGEPRFLGLRFPATDIPAQARRLYVLEHTRLIADVEADRVPVEPVTNPTTGRPLNMAFCQLRAVSPIHIEYLQNMRVAASFSVSVVSESRLDALIACHHSRPRRIPFEARQACEILGRALGQRVTQSLEVTRQATRNRVLSAQVNLLSELAQHAQLDLSSGAWERARDFVDSDCTIVHIDGRTRVLGPPPENLELLEEVAQRLARAPAEERATDGVGDLVPGTAGGMLAISILQRGWIAWYRNPRDQVVSWGGRVELAGDKRLNPRTSFELWKQEIRGRGLPWSREELEVAEVLRRGLFVRFSGPIRDGQTEGDAFETALDHLREYVIFLERNHEIQRRRNQDLRQFAHVASHDLRSPLRTIRSFLPLVRTEVEPTLSEKSRRYLDFVANAAESMAQVQEGLWAFAKIAGDGAFQPVDLAEVAQRVVAALAADLGDQTITIGALPTVRGIPGQLERLLHNLLENSIKYRSDERPLHVVLDGRMTGADHIVSVSDNGIGFPVHETERAFELFTRLHPDRAGGQGLGLALCRRIVHHHEGWIHALGQSSGATVEFGIPREGPG